MRLAISTTETLTDLKTDLVVANNNNKIKAPIIPTAFQNVQLQEKLGCGFPCCDSLYYICHHCGASKYARNTVHAIHNAPARVWVAFETS